MEALAAVGFAANILQFVDYVCHVFNLGSQLRRHGMSDFNFDLERSTKFLENQMTRIQSQQGAATGLDEADQVLDKLAKECIVIAKELRSVIDSSKINAKSRPSIKTLAKAIQLEWKKPKIEELARKLDEIRNRLYSEVMLSIQKSVKNIKERADHSSQLLENISASHLVYHTESLGALQNNHLAVENMLQAQSNKLSLMDDASKKRQDSVIQAVNSFTEALKGRLLFPTVPDIVTEADPSLKSAALNGYEAIESAVLAALYFRKMEIREAQVKEAYENTCSWIFEDPEKHEKPWSNFGRWLEEENGCYWIEGKAGCGKSTLMKLVRSDSRTKTALKKWAGADELITASYFFWMAGTTLQKNQEGLLRSLLYTILSQRRDLISRVFPRQYDAMMTTLFATNSSPDIFFSCDSPGCSSSFEQLWKLEEHRKRIHTVKDCKHDKDVCGTMTLAELKMAFNTLAIQNLKGFKICLFIDGLDEYVGDQQDVVDLFKTMMSHSSIIKAVISSRPEPIFVEAFHSFPKLRVENLTAGDIDHYIKSKLLSHSKVRKRKELVERLGHNIRSKACGVFLWVFLVVKMLFECLNDGTYPEDLERMIEKYPQELHELYKHMFERMKVSHRQEGFRLFQAVFHAQNIESSIPTALRLSFVDRDQPTRSIQMQLEIMTPVELQERLSSFEARLRSRCCGLLEVQYDDPLSSPQKLQAEQDQEAINLHTEEKQERIYSRLEKPQEGRITYLHRTVSDFLKEPDVRQIIERETQGSNSEIYERLLASILYCFKARRFFVLTNPFAWKKYLGEIMAFLVYCQRREFCADSSQIDYIEEFDQRLAQFWEVRSKRGVKQLGDYEHHWAESLLKELRFKLTTEPDDDPLLTLAARCGLCIYARSKLRAKSSSKSFFNTSGRLLVVRLSYWAMYDNSLSAHHIRIIEHFLEAGLKVNDKNSGPTAVWGRTPWEELLYLQPHKLPSQASRLSTGLKIDDKGQADLSRSEVGRLDVWIQIVELFIRAGAELDVKFKPFKGATRGRTARDVIHEVMKKSQMGQGLCSEDSANVQREILRIEKLLAEIPMRAARPNLETIPSNLPAHSGSHSPTTSICSSSQKISTTGDESLFSYQHQKGHGSLSPNQEKPEGRVKSRSSTFDSMRIVQPCFRCKTVDELTGLGFKPDEIFRAMENAGVGYDVPALVNWLLNAKSNDAKVISQLEFVSPRLANELKIPQPVQVRPPESAAKQWSTVAKKDSADKKHNDVVGAQYVVKPKRRKSRRSKRGSSITTEITMNEVNSSGGTIDLNTGTFTWFFDPKDQAQSVAALSGDLQKRFQELVESMLARG